VAAMVRMKDVASKLGLSPTTVSYVLSGKHLQHRIGEETVKRVRQMAEKMGYRTSALARALKAQRSNSIALVVGDIANPFWAGVAVGAQTEAEKRGYTLFICNTQDTLERERRTVYLLQERFVDGLIISPARLDEAYLNRLQKQGRPFVLIDRVVENLDVPTVRTDSYAGSEMAVDHLVRRGARSIAFIGGPERISTFRDRLAGFRAALSKRGLQPAAVLLTEGTHESALDASRALLSRSPRPAAIYSANTIISIALLQAVQESGASLPLVGFDELPMGGLLRTPISAVAQDVDAMGREALKLLLKVMNNEPAESVLLQPRFIERKP
jgi:LacI family transcriptional regulator